MITASLLREAGAGRTPAAAADPVVEATAFSLWRQRSHPMVAEPEWQRMPEVVRGFYRGQARAALLSGSAAPGRAQSPHR